MSQNQKTFFAQINDQLIFVLTLTKQLKSQMLSIFSSKRIGIYFLRHFQKMEHYLSKISYLNDEEIDSFDSQNNSERLFMRKTLAQIIGPGQYYEPQEFQENLQISSSENQQIFNENSSKNQALIRGPYRSYRVEEKLKVLRLYRQGKTYAFISRLLGIPQKNIVRWCKNGVLRKMGAGRKIGDIQMQKGVIKWINRNFKQGDIIRSKQIRQKAINLSTKREFKSSKGWLKNFIRRHNLNKNFEIQ